MASKLYEWNAAASASLFELIHHFEVLLRNKIISQLNHSTPSQSLLPGTPWTQEADSIQEVAARIKKRGKVPTPGRIYSGLTFGFWQSLFENKYEELWRHSLQYVFPNSKADRSTIAEYLASIGYVRNRIAHHGSTLEIDLQVEAQKIIRLVGWMDKDAETWMKSIQQKVISATNERPVTPLRNVAIIPDPKAWDLYINRKQNACIVKAGRSIRNVDYLAFYANHSIQAIITKIEHRFDAIDWNGANAKKLNKSSSSIDKDIAKIIQASKANGWNDPVYQVFLLSSPKDENTITLPAPIPHPKRGRGSAFAKQPRYHTLASLQSARDTTDLESPPHNRRATP